MCFFQKFIEDLCSIKTIDRIKGLQEDWYLWKFGYIVWSI